MSNIETRLEQLELQLHLVRKQRRLERRIGAAVAAILGAATLAGFARPMTPEVIQASRLEILDAEGKISCLLSSSPSGGQLDVWAKGGANVARLSSSESGGDLALWNTAGKPVAGLFANSTGGRVEVTRGDGQIAAFLEATKDGSNFTLTRSGSEDSALQLMVAADRSEGLLNRPNGKPALRFGVNEKGAAFSVVGDSSKEVAYLGSDTKQAGLLRLAGADGATAMEGGVGDGGGELAIRENNGAGGCVLGNVAGHGGFAEIRNHDGKAAVSLEVQENLGGRATVRTAVGQIAALMDQGKDESGTVQIYAGATRVAALGGGSTGGLLNLFNMKGKAVVVAGAASDADGGLISLRNASGQQTIRAAAEPSGEVASYSSDGTRKRVLSAP
ncbi:MAG: hypothetical protein K8R92_11230 [Planctomycetes bacterium]|nr:hypothetical protein [Planctomycetota bacterium]